MHNLYKTLTFTAIITAVLFVVSIFFLTVQTYNNSGTDSATVLSGVLSMFGGVLGALGAYLVARHQMNKQQRERENELKIISRPIINCAKANNVKENLSNLKFSDSAILLSDTTFSEASNEKYCSFYVIQFIGSFTIVLNVEITIIMTDGVNKTYPLGGIKQDNEILLSVPITKKVSTIKSERSTDKVIINYITEKHEKIKFVYDNRNLNERYYLITNGKEKLLRKSDFQAGTWQMPGRFNND